MSTYTIRDTFNNTTVSRHRTLDAAVKAERRFLRAVKRANGQSSYIPTEILKDGQQIDADELCDARLAADQA